MTSSTKASACALSPGKVAMFFQKGDDCQPVLVMTTAEAISLANEIVSAANVAKEPRQPTETDTAMTADKLARRQLAIKANYEIFKLAEAAAKVCTDEDHPVYHGMMARIKTLTEISFYAMQLDDGAVRDVVFLERLFDGLMP